MSHINTYLYICTSASIEGKLGKINDKSSQSSQILEIPVIIWFPNVADFLPTFSRRFHQCSLSTHIFSIHVFIHLFPISIAPHITCWSVPLSSLLQRCLCGFFYAV